MKKVLEDLLERLNADFKNLFRVEYDILWYVLAKPSSSQIQILPRLKVPNQTICP